MNEFAVTEVSGRSRSALKKAVYQNSAISKQGLLERLFTLVFDNLVYSQIWEDPIVDMQAMAIRPGDHVVTLASGGCNVLSYLTADPGRITAVDLNSTHLSLTNLKLSAIQNLPSYKDFRRFFAEADNKLNEKFYHLYIEPRLDTQTRRYWSGRSIFYSQRIKMFSRNFYRFGMLGYFINLAHLVAKFHGTNPKDILNSKDISDQKHFFENRLAPIFKKKIVRWLTSTPVSLYGLGIPPAQYHELSEGYHMADVLCERLKKLACDFPLDQNYFARQAFARSYVAENSNMTLPPYLLEENWKLIRDRVNRVETIKGSVTEILSSLPVASVDRIVLLDAQDWMDDRQLNDLWQSISKVAAPDARVIFRTAAKSSPLETRIDQNILTQWFYNREVSEKFTAKDRSAIYGGFHTYEFTP